MNIYIGFPRSETKWFLIIQYGGRWFTIRAVLLIGTLFFTRVELLKLRKADAQGLEIRVKDSEAEGPGTRLLLFKPLSFRA